MRLGIRIFVGVLVIIGIALGAFAYMNRPISEVAVTGKIAQHLATVVEESDDLSSALLTIHSDKTGYSEQFAVGTMRHASDQPVRTDSPYHSASVGKTMCAAIFGMLVDEGKISYDDPIRTWLGDDVLQGLFVVDGTDYSSQVTIRHLLSHTSGAGDYFEGPVKSGQPMLELIAANPDRSFTPKELIAFTRDYQEPVGRPGQQFYYSDTSYILLGLILEAIEGQAYSAILEARLFEPLGMDDSYLMFSREEPADIVGVYANGIDLSDRPALSVDWSGGGVVTTMDDLLTFMRALVNGSLLSDEAYGQMTDFAHRYEKGIYYGMGMMAFDFSELSFLLGSMSDVYGGVGATGTYVLYDPKEDTYYIANFGSLAYAEKSIEELVKIRMIYGRMITE